MIVDDDPDDRFFFRRAVEQLGPSYEYCGAQHGVDALEYLRRASTLPDFIFLDLNMPVMDGKECLAELRKDASLKDIPVIIYTTAFHDRSIEAVLNLGADFYLLKPFDVSKLDEGIDNAIKQVKEYDNKK